METLFDGAISIRGIAVFAIIVALIYVWVFAVAMCDLRAGIRKAKQRGEYKSSKKMRRTIEKMTTYYNIMLAVSLVDALLIFALALMRVNIPRIPYMTFVGGILIGIIEIKSIYEKAEDKQKADIQDALAILSQVLTKDDIKELLLKLAEAKAELAEEKAEG